MSGKPVKVRCQKCGKEASYDESETKKYGRAFDDGWDLPDWCPVTTCPKCSSGELLVKLLKDADNAQR